MTIDLAQEARDKGIDYFLISFVDLFGVMRAKLAPASAIADMAKEGASFAGFAASRHSENDHIVGYGDRSAETVIFLTITRSQLRDLGPSPIHPLEDVGSSDVVPLIQSTDDGGVTGNRDRVSEIVISGCITGSQLCYFAPVVGSSLVAFENMSCSGV